MVALREDVSSIATPARSRRPTLPFTLPHFRAWTSNLVLDTGEKWVPEPFQEWFVEDLFAGYPEVWFLVPEGNTKTTTLAGLALYHCEFKPFASVPVAAASREQAEILYRQAEGFVLRSSRMHRSVHSSIQRAKGKNKTDVPRFVCLEGYRRINHVAGGRIQVFAADDRTGDGILPSLAILDEPHRLNNLSLYRTWAGKLLKRDGQIAAISTSGEPESDFEITLARIRDGATSVQRDGSFTRYATDRVVLHEWALPREDDPDDMVAVKRANPFSGITIDTLREKHDSPTMTASHWLRFVCNRPTLGEDCWLGPNAATIWKDLEQPYTMRPGVRTYVGVDIGLKIDTSAVVAVQRRDDGRWHAVCRIWTPTPDRPVDVTDVMEHIRQLAKRLDVEAIGFDPRFFDVPAKMLTDEGLDMIEVPQGVERMTPAYLSLLDAVLAGKITHDDNTAFTAQVLNAVARQNSDRSFMLDKRKSHGKIDAAAALAMAFDQALRHETDEPSMYETRGLRTFG